MALVEPQAAPGARYVAHFKVGHGCSGSPTVALTVAIPAAVTAVVPETPEGWQVATVREGARITAVTWKGGVIAADKPGMFAVAIDLAGDAGRLVFPATQTCESGEEHWAEVDVEKSTRPAPILQVIAEGAAPSPLVVSEAWFRALPASAPSGAYFTLRNTGKKPATLTGADSPACGMLMLHQSEEKGGMSSMRDMETVTVPPGGEVRLAPGGLHLMCMDAKPLLRPGASVTVRLSFADAAPVAAQFEVRNAAGQ